MNLRWAREDFIQLYQKKKTDKEVDIMMDFISFCDGQRSLLEIAESLNVPMWDLYDIVDKLVSHNLITTNE